MRLHNFVPLLIGLITLNINAQAPGISWSEHLGGSKEDVAKSVQQTSDQGFIIAGYSNSGDYDVNTALGGYDFWIVKLNESGTVLWKNNYGGTGDEQANSIQETSDGGFIVAGYATINDGQVTGTHGNKDFWVIKISSAGGLIWQKAFGGSWDDTAYSVQQTLDGGYIVAGSSASNDGDIQGGHHGMPYSTHDYWIIKLDSSGNLLWDKSLGGNMDDNCFVSVQQTNDGGYIVAGSSTSNDGDVQGGHHGGSTNTYNDAWVVRLDTNGAILWQKSLGGTNQDQVFSVTQTTDGGFVVAGLANSSDGDVPGNYGWCDCWLVKLNPSGVKEWEKNLGGTEIDLAFSIKQTIDGGFIIAGQSNSYDIDVIGGHGNFDYWLVKTNSSGDIEWQECFGGSGMDMASSVQQTTDGGFIIAGQSLSNDQQVGGNYGDYDYWIVKTIGPWADVNAYKNKDLKIYPNPMTGDTFTIAVEDILLEATVRVMDVNGHVACERSSISSYSEEITVQCPDMASGNYIVQLFDKLNPVSNPAKLLVIK